jgi:hypothetical protein
MHAGIRITIVYVELPHMVELEFQSSNGSFTGTASLYVPPDILSVLAEKLGGFPAGLSDSRKVELGATEKGVAGGGASIVFSCKDNLGHVSVEVRVVSDSAQTLAQSAQLVFVAEPAAIDKFVEQLKVAKIEVGAAAYLPAAT